MRYSAAQIVFQEVPNEISLAFHATGCPLRCTGCHSSDSWNSQMGLELNTATLAAHIKRYRKYISCVLYLGGEWEAEELTTQLDYVKSRGLKTALYTGLDYSQVDGEILRRLDFLKYGEYNAELGPLTSKKSNQRLVNLKTHENLGPYFSDRRIYDSTR